MAKRAVDCRAFSLVEVSVLVATIAIAAAMAAPRYGNSLANYRVQSAAQRIAADLNLARSQAKISSLGQNVVFNLSSNSYSLPGVAGLRGQPSPYSVSLKADPYQSTMLSASFANTVTVTFDRYGQPSSGGTVSIQSGIYLKSVVVDSNTGLASVQ